MDKRKARLIELLSQQKKIYDFKTNSDLARAIGIEIGAFGTYYRGTSFPDTQNLQKIADFLKISVEELGKRLDGSEALKAKENGSIYKVGKKAEDLVPIASELPDPEKIRLARILLDLAVI